MAREDRDSYDARTTRSSHRGDTETNERPVAGRAAAGADPLNPGWRGARTAARPASRTQGLPSSRQEFILWLQYGGWRIAVVAAAIVVILVLMIYVSSTPKPGLQTARPTDVIEQEAGALNLPALATPTIGPISPTAAPAVLSGARFRVFNTGSEGLFLRPDHNTNQPPVKTLPEGSIVTVIGQDFSGPDRVWKNVRDTEGSEGWVAADFLQAAP